MNELDRREGVSIDDEEDRILMSERGGVEGGVARTEVLFDEDELLERRDPRDEARVEPEEDEVPMGLLDFEPILLILSSNTLAPSSIARRAVAEAAAVSSSFFEVFLSIRPWSWRILVALTTRWAT